MINLYMPLKNTSEKDKTQGGETLKLRNINRGLVLGGVLALGVVCYTVYDNNQFKTSKPEIEQTMRDYIADLTSANVGSSDKLKSQLTDFVNKHYTDYTTSASWPLPEHVHEQNSPAPRSPAAPAAPGDEAHREASCRRGLKPAPPARP